MHKLSRSTAMLFSLVLAAAMPAMASERDVLDGDAMLITSGDPQDPTYANAGENLRTGVGSMFIEFAGTAPFGFVCTMAVIDDQHILTAAHCLREPGDTVTQVILVLPSGTFAVELAAGFAVHPFYDILNPIVGAFAPGDIAVVKLQNPLPAEVERYALYRDADEFGQETRHYGHGRSGRGNKGAMGGSDFFYARTGLNQYEQTMIPFFGSPLFDQLLHDYDSGGSKHNAMAWWFSSRGACHPDNPQAPDQAQNGQCTTFKDGSYPDFKGFGKLEVGVAPGDSGGPGFIDGRIAGVHSFGFTHFCAGVTNGTDFSCGLDSSYGEMSGDTRVSSYAGWIDAVVAGVVPLTPVPEVAPAAPAADASANEAVVGDIAADGSQFMSSVFSRQLRQPVNIEHVKTTYGIDAE